MRPGHRWIVGAIALLLAGFPAVTARAVPGCDTTPTAGFETRSPYAGREVESVLTANPAYSAGQNPYVYDLFVPEELPHREVPLLIALHGLGNSASNMHAKQLEDLATREGFILAFPSGARSWWATEDSADTAFVRDVVADVRGDRCVDATRIWAMGVSNGAFMVQRLACDAADVFAAVAAWAATPVDGTYPFGGPCRANEDQAPGFETAPIAFWQGTADETVAYETGRRAMQHWVDRYRCDTVPVVEETSFGPIEHFGHCMRTDALARAETSRAPFEVRFRTVNGHPHVYPDPAPGLPTAEQINEELFDFLSRHPRATPAPDQGEPDVSDVPVRDPERHGDWLTTPPDPHGPPTDVALVDASGAPIATSAALAAGVINVEYAVFGDATNPSCPATSAGSGKIRIVGRAVTLRITDEQATTELTAPTAEQAGTGLAVASFSVPAVDSGSVVVEATVEDDRFASAHLCTARGARFQETVNTRQRG